MSERLLTDFELMLLLAVLRVGEDAYGVTIARELEETGGRTTTLAAIYLALERMREGGLVRSRLGQKTPRRGGRAKKMWSVTGAGLRAIKRTRNAFVALWKGIPELKGARA